MTYLNGIKLYIFKEIKCHFNFFEGMGVVDVCPRRQIDITTASKKLGCKNDTYGNNKYMCVPKDDKSSLVEICYDGNMGIEEPGK